MGQRAATMNTPPPPEPPEANDPPPRQPFNPADPAVWRVDGQEQTKR